MNKFSVKSQENIDQCDKVLQDIFNDALQVIDISIICGHRGKAEQNKAYLSGNSKSQYPDSKHNKQPSIAVDAIPYPTGYSSVKHFYVLNGIVQTLAKQKNVLIRWGGDWDMDNDFADNNFNDLAHWELI